MNQHRPRSTTRTALVVTLLAVATLGLGANPAGARPFDVDPAPRLVRPLGACELEKVGMQLVRCDDLTGNGVAAPWYIPEQ